MIKTLVASASGKLIDVYQPGDGSERPLPVILIWHGLGPDERDILQPLAEEVVGRGAVVFASDWRSDAPDGGRADLLDSIRFVLAHAASFGGDPERFVLAGWSAGAGAAVSVALRPELLDGWRPVAVVGIAGHYGLPARTTGETPLDDLAATSAGPVPVRLIHGTGDVILDVQNSRDFAEALKGRGWPVHLDEVATDHAGVIMTEYSPELNRCVPTVSASAVQGGRVTAESLIRATESGAAAQ
ncbi:alpha/beta hydrolase [Streptomyces sp. NPDC050485]|uniref:alpha/beta hydrolase n=1 Tax=Streptomyces sp. NPDC050485 TaxID=3365617 RepID=UPI0037AA62B1